MNRNTINLLVELTKKQVRLRYKRTVLGAAWSLLNPILMMCVFTLIFSRFPRLTGSQQPYYLFFLCGYLPWHFFSLCLQNGKDSITANTPIVKQAAFDRAVLPASAVAANLFHFAISLVLLTAFVAAHDGLSPSPLSALIFPLAIVQALFCYGIAQILSALNVFFRDTGQALEVGLTFLFYLTPVFYDRSFFHQTDPIIAALLGANPMARFIELYRALLIAPESLDPFSLAYVIGWTALVLYAGRKAFKRYAPSFAKEL